MDTINGAGGDDIITIAAAGKGNTDVMDGGADADVLQLSTGAHAFADNDKLKNIETIKTASGGSEVDLSAQQEALTITGDAGVDKVTGGEGVDTIDGAGGDDIITIAAAGKGNTDVMDGGADADVLQLSTGAHAFADNDKLKNIETIKTASGGSEVDLSAQTEALTITGGDSIDVITGGKGIDTINSGAGVDTIIGGEGDDIITGGADNDIILTGGAGNDTFNMNSGFDTITDLSGSDILIVSSGATVSASGIDAFTATSNTKNDGTANLTTDNDGGTINMASSSGAFTLTGGAGDDILLLGMVVQIRYTGWVELILSLVTQELIL